MFPSTGIFTSICNAKHNLNPNVIITHVQNNTNKDGTSAIS